MTDIFADRKYHQQLLDEIFADEVNVIHQAFELIDEIVEHLSVLAKSNEVTRIQAIFIARMRRLIWGTHVLILEGLELEAGALIRTYFEGFDLIEYLARDSSRLDEIMMNKFKAGEIAQELHGDAPHRKTLRDRMHTASAHFGYTPEVVRATEEPATKVIHTMTRYLPEDLRIELRGQFVACSSLINTALDVIEKQATIPDNLIHAYNAWGVEFERVYPEYAIGRN